MNLFSLALLIILFPTIFQLVIGSLVVKKILRFPFKYVALFSLFSQLFSIFLARSIIIIDAHNQNINCGMPIAAMLFAGGIFTIILVIAIIIQLLIRRKIDNTEK